MTNQFKTIILCGLFLLAVGAFSASAETDIFSQKVEPLTTLDCARCHEQVFTDLRDRGGAHKMVCRDCHEQFHTFKRDLGWEQRVPACTSCHGEPHGSEADMIDCLDCHSNPHAPVDSLSLELLEPLCARCHAEPTQQMQQPSAHSELGCNECHQQQHGSLPKCTECHEEPHSPFESNAGCMQCHPVHNVSIMLYSETIPNNACAGCHSQPAQQLKQGHLAHALLNCTFCHADEHGNTPSCQDCHDTPHSPEMLQDFAGCNDCHGNPHDLLPGA